MLVYLTRRLRTALLRYTVSRWYQGETEPTGAVPIIYALHALESLDVPTWPRPQNAKLPPITAIKDSEAWKAVAHL